MNLQKIKQSGNGITDGTAHINNFMSLNNVINNYCSNILQLNLKSSDHKQYIGADPIYFFMQIKGSTDSNAIKLFMITKLKLQTFINLVYYEDPVEYISTIPFSQSNIYNERFNIYIEQGPIAYVASSAWCFIFPIRNLHIYTLY